MKHSSLEKDLIKLTYILCRIFLLPFWMMLIWDYLQDDIGLPTLGYWQMFFIKFFVSCLRPNYYQTKTEWEAECK